MKVLLKNTDKKVNGEVEITDVERSTLIKSIDFLNSNVTEDDIQELAPSFPKLYSDEDFFFKIIEKIKLSFKTTGDIELDAKYISVLLIAFDLYMIYFNIDMIKQAEKENTLLLTEMADFTTLQLKIITLYSVYN